MDQKKILVVGELNVDLILNEIDGFPKIGSEIVANKMDFKLGSSSAILASNISSLGIEASFCGMVGSDNFGDFILEQLTSNKVDTQFIEVSNIHQTGLTVVMNYDQDRANVTYCGAMSYLKIEHIPWKKLTSFNHLHLSSYFLQDGMKNDIPQLFQRARKMGLTTSLDLQFDPAEKWDFNYKSCLPFVDVFFPNEIELQAITGEEDIDKAIKKLKPYANSIALKLGKKGARFINDQDDFKVPPYIMNDFKDAIGAGDSFNAGFLQKFLQGAPANDCLKNGNLMGALNTTAPGGTTAFSAIETIDNQIAEIIKQQS